MSTVDTKRQLYVKRLDAINNRISSLLLQLNKVNRRVTNIDESLNRLPIRVKQIRKMNYRVMISLEKEIAYLSEGWSNLKPTITSIIESNLPILLIEGRSISNEIAQRRFVSEYDVSQLANIEFRVSKFSSQIKNLESEVRSSTGDILNKLQSLELDIGIAEKTISLSTSSSFKWKEGESPILSVNAKDLNNNVDGILSLTSHRLIFELKKEVVLKKTLFIATQKKTIRETIVDKPIGMVDNIVKGRVGILAGQGLYITFKRDAGQQEMKLDTKGNDTDRVLRFYKFISSGEADQELNMIKGSKSSEQQSVPIICLRCGAPYSEEIYRGQTSLKCKYCLTTIPIAR